MKARIMVLALMALSGCTRHSRLDRVTLWEGDADCTSCQAHAVPLWPNGPARVTLKEGSLYTAQLELEAADDPDRCVFEFVSGTWDLPSHSFDCDPEHDVIRRSISTSRFTRNPAGDALFLRVEILSSTGRRSLGLLLDTQRYEVDWNR